MEVSGENYKLREKGLCYQRVRALIVKQPKFKAKTNKDMKI